METKLKAREQEKYDAMIVAQDAFLEAAEKYVLVDPEEEDGSFEDTFFAAYTVFAEARWEWNEAYETECAAREAYKAFRDALGKLG